MAFNPNIPQAADALSKSQLQLLNNNININTSYGIDHYDFADDTANKGFHNQVTTPIIDPAGHPNTTADYCRFYAMQDDPTLPILQYSRGVSDAVPTPVTNVQGPTGGETVPSTSTIDILDYSTLVDLACEVYAYPLNLLTIPTQAVTAQVMIYAAVPGTPAGRIISSGGGGALTIQFGANVLQIANSSGSGIAVHWVIKILRMQ